MDKNQIIARGIKAILDIKRWSIETIMEKTPKGFMIEVAKILPPDLPFTSTANDISNYLNKRKGQNKKDVLDIVRGLYADNVDNVDNLSTEQTLQTQQLTEDDVRRIVCEEINKRLSDVEAISLNEHTVLVPEADTIKGQGQGRRLKRDYERVSITVDRELWKLFRKEQRQLKTTSPRLMDSILWAHYGQPKLSFEVEEKIDA